jgi:threonine synthase
MSELAAQGSMLNSDGIAPGYLCGGCGTRYRLDLVAWRCHCGGVLDLTAPEPFAAELIDHSEAGLWRYAAALPPLPASARIRLGEVVTPMVYVDRFHVHLKLDYMLPTSSYKDRGSAVLLSRVHHSGVQSVVEDSSGNAGASIAAYSAAAGIKCRVFVPSTNSPHKLAQIVAYGAELIAVEGSRSDVAESAMRAAERTFYASHVWQPQFIAGVATAGFEIWEQMGGYAPEAIIVPCGYGSIVLGLIRAFEALKSAGAIAVLPRIFAVQTEAFSSVADAWADGLEDPEPVQRAEESLAEGIACKLPLRGREVLRALRASRGAAVKVSDAAIQRAWLDLAGAGFYVEPTSATVLAGLRALEELGTVVPAHSNVVLVLTGSGLKTNLAVIDRQLELGPTRSAIEDDRYTSP